MKAELRNYIEKTSFMTPCYPVADLIAFGEDKYQEYKNYDGFLAKFTTSEGLGYIAYKITGADIEVDDIYYNGTDSLKESNIIESLIYFVRNNAASKKSKLKINKVDAKVKAFLLKRNDKLDKQGIAKKYQWYFEEE